MMEEGASGTPFFHIDNSWTNDALKACGQKACWWTPLDDWT